MHMHIKYTLAAVQPLCTQEPSVEHCHIKKLAKCMSRSDQYIGIVGQISAAKLLGAGSGRITDLKLLECESHNVRLQSSVSHSAPPPPQRVLMLLRSNLVNLIHR